MISLNKKKRKDYAATELYGMRHILPHLKQVKEALEARKAQRDSLLYRQQMIEAQKRQNYQNEYDRVRSHREKLAGRLPVGTVQKLLDREEELKHLAKQSLAKISGEIPY